MLMSPFVRPNDGDDALQPIPFHPPEQCDVGSQASENNNPTGLPEELSSTTDDLFDTLDTMSRRIDDLARELNCFGYFDDGDDDRPRAA